MIINRIYCFLFVLLFVFPHCTDFSKKSQPSDSIKPLFTLLPPSQTNINFANSLEEGLNTNVMIYEYFYNGGGVAVADVNGDGLQDIYFTGNMTDNKLYLNKGKMQFEDVTNTAGVAGRPGPWKTGVTMVDINGDGKEDFYVSYSGKLRGEKRVKQLFINDGNDDSGIPHFTDQAAQYGLDDSSFSTQAVFFDYDNDADLDLLLLNHSIIKRNVLDEATIKKLLQENDHLSGIKLLRNDKGHFTEVTSKSGITGTVLSHGLGIAISDVNQDGAPDIYISNDYLEPDFLYINNKNGTFSDRLKSSVGHTSFFSMGNDISDINNDALPDVFTLDMLPESNHRQKLLFAPDNYEKVEVNIRSGFHYQFMRNMLHLNNGDGTFSEIGQFAGIANTDWSWAPLFADYDNDGWKDLYVTNGYVHDYTNMDFMKYMSDLLQDRSVMRKDLLELVNKMPSSNVINCAFKNNGDLTFANTSSPWGFNTPSNSNGAAYADLDNDGDLDLIVNNINQPAFIYRNEANNRSRNHFLKVKLEGSGLNSQGLGAKITLFNKGKKQYLEQSPSRGFQSSVSPVLHFGLGAEAGIDSLQIVWQSGKQQKLTNVKSDQTLTLQEKNAVATYKLQKPEAPIYHETKAPIPYHNESNTINDFKRQPLLINPLSFAGPCLVKGDVNGDGLDDIYTGGGSGQPGAIYIQLKNGKFDKKISAPFESDKQSEDADAVFFDANGDGFKDLYVASGGYHNYMPNDALLQDRLYLNDGHGNLTRDIQAVPEMHVSKSCVRVADINADGHPDVFVGGRVVPGRYPETPRSYILLNDGHGHFTDATQGVAMDLQKAGMVTDAAWLDLNGDKKEDLVIVGEWMPVTVFINTGGRLEDKTSSYFDKQYSGWWNKLLTGDFNNDGKIDLVVGNLGLNTQCKASDKQPAEMYYKDFDDNGSVDPILCFYIQDTSYPYVTRDELLDQMSSMRTRYTDYKGYADATIHDVFSPEELKDAGHLKANFLKTAFFVSGKDGKFHEKSLPAQAQFSPVFTLTQFDADKDGVEDLLLCGNINHARLRFGNYDANYGTLLKGDGKGNFSYVGQQRSGFRLRGDIRSVVNINNTLLFGINQGEIKAYTSK